MIAMALKAAASSFGAASLLNKLLIAGGMLLALAVAGGVIYMHIWNEGYHAALAAVAAKDEKALKIAREYRAASDSCHDVGLRWSQLTGKCERR